MSAFQDIEPNRSTRLLGTLLKNVVATATGVLDDILIVRMLILRNLKTKYRGHPLGLILEFMQPVIICTVHYYYFVFTQKTVPANQYYIFTIGGFTIWFCFQNAFRKIYAGSSSATSAINIPSVSIMHSYVATAFWSFLVYFSFAIIVPYPGRLLGVIINPPDVLLTAITYGISACLGFGFGLLTVALVGFVPALDPFVKLFRWAIFITSGIYDSIVYMSPVTAPLIWYNPLIHLAEYQRHAFYPGYPVYLVSLSYPLKWAAGLMIAGLLSHRALANRHPRRIISA